MIQRPTIKEKCVWVRSNTLRDERPVATGLDRFFSVFRFFDKHHNWQPKKFRICATATGGLVFCSWVQSDFGLFSSPVNWTCEHYFWALVVTSAIGLISLAAPTISYGFSLILSLDLVKSKVDGCLEPAFNTLASFTGWCTADTAMHLILPGWAFLGPRLMRGSHLDVLMTVCLCVPLSKVAIMGLRLFWRSTLGYFLLLGYI